MRWVGCGRRSSSAPRSVRPGVILAALAALLCTACNPQNRPEAANGAMRGATVAFDSIDGPPPGQFETLVEYLNDEAQTRHMAVLSREGEAAYRVRGYIAVSVADKRTTVAWVWDVFDRSEHRALRIRGEDTSKGAQRDAWAAADDHVLRQIARLSMEQLAAFLTSPEVAPGTPDGEPRRVVADGRGLSPEAAGIVRIPQIEAAADAAPSVRVPLPPRRPDMAAQPGRETLALAAVGR